MSRKQEFDDRLLVRINKADIENLDKVAVAKGTTRSNLVREILQRYVRRWKARNSGAENVSDFPTLED
jgi:metal-responsive CopG/Arc/MetJ family transcriptional regulator